MVVKNKVKFKYRAEIERRRQTSADGTATSSKRLSGKAGYFRKGSKMIFKIKYGFFPWNVIDLTKLPDPKYMDSENTVYYLQLNKDSLVQAKKSVDWTNGGIELEPVESDMKYGALLDIHERDVILQQQSAWQKYGGPVLLSLIFVTGIVVFYFIQRACGT